MIARDEVTYRLLNLASGLLGGVIADALVSRIWRTFSNTDELPNPAAPDRHSREVLIAAAIQGAIFGLVKAALSRITAKGYRRFEEGSSALGGN